MKLKDALALANRKKPYSRQKKETSQFLLDGSVFKAIKQVKTTDLEKQWTREVIS